MKTLTLILITTLCSINLYASRTFTNVSAEVKSSTVVLTWSINFTDNLGEFQIQRMDENGVFQPIQAINSSEQLTYKYVDINPDIGKNYYRIAFILDDNVYNSKIVMITCDSAESLVIYPNPSNGEYLNVTLNGTSSDNATIRIFDKSGALVKDLVLKPEMNNTYILNNLNIESGIYYLMISTPTATLKKKFLIEK